MASYYKVSTSEDSLPPLYRGFHLQKVKKFRRSLPRIKYDFSKHVLVELLDSTTPESKLWAELGLSNSRIVIHKRMMVDSHRIQCRRAIIVCVSPEEAKKLAERVSQTKIMNRSICASVVKDLLSDLCLFEKQIVQFGDLRPQHQLVYVTDLNRCRGPSGLVNFLKQTFSPFGTVLSVLVCSDNNEYASPEGVVRFAYLSEAFAAELALDQFVVGKERLSVTAHHNILLSQCDLRVRLREAQWKNRATDFELDSYELNDLSTLDENSVVNSINSLCTSSRNITENLLSNLTHPRCDKTLSNNLSPPRDDRYLSNNISHRRDDDRNLSNNLSHNTDDTNLSNNQCDKVNLLKNSKCDNNVVNIPNRANSRTSKSYRNAVSSKTEMDVNNSLNSSTLRVGTAYNIVEQTKGCLNSGTFTRRVLRDAASDCESFVSCVPDPKCLAAPEEMMSFTCLHYDGRDANSEYYSVSSNYGQLSTVHQDSKFKKRLREGRSSKKRKYFTPSQKLCLKSQRVGFSQQTVQTVATQSCSSQSEKSTNGFSLTHKEKKDAANLNSKPEEPWKSRVTSWLSSQSASTDFHSMDESLASSTKAHKNRISIHDTPALSHKNVWKHCRSTDSDADSSVENDDPNMNLVGNLSVLCSDKSRSPLQAWLKQELVSSINNNVTQSQEPSKSVIVCAARTKDFIISVGCSHMTCNFCYPDSTDLLLGFS